MPSNLLLVAIVTAFVVVLCVMLHYEALRFMPDVLPKPKHHHRRRIVLLILGLLLAHTVEIWLFDQAYYGLLLFGDVDDLVGMGPTNLFDCVYYSAIVFSTLMLSTLGFSDIVPMGSIRFLTGTEAFAGLTFIIWSASFTFMKMSKSWSQRD